MLIVIIVIIHQVPDEDILGGITLLFLSPYSPDLNPIEQIWKSIKRDVSVNFIASYENLKSIISDSWNEFRDSLSYARGWME
ncbi:hypothetical protein CKO12_13640 [Chromatium okenii]|nr:hypothetical protein [Chromatium okenii]